MPKPQTLYISGPMTGIPNYNRYTFDAVQKTLEEIGGYRVINPHTYAASSPGHDWIHYIEYDLKQIHQAADGLALLPGWQNSKGARIEVTVAGLLDIPTQHFMWWVDRARAQRRREKAAAQ